MCLIKLLCFQGMSKYGKHKSFIVSLVMHLLVIAAILTTPLISGMTKPQVLFVTMHGESALRDEKTASVSANLVRIPSKVIHEDRLLPGAQRVSDRPEAQNSSEALIPPEKTIIEDQPVQQARMSASLPYIQGASAPGKSESSILTAGQAGADADSAKGDRIFNAGNARFGERGAPSFVHQEVPVYPALARRLGKEGRVLLKLLIDADGKLKHVEVVEAAGYGFTEASLDAVKRSTYEPGFQNGVKVAMRVLLPVSFRMQ